MLLSSVAHRWWATFVATRRLFPITGSRASVRTHYVCQTSIIPTYYRPQRFRYHAGLQPHALFRDGPTLRASHGNRFGATIILLSELEHRARSLAKSITDLEALEASYAAQMLSERERYEEQCIGIGIIPDYDEQLAQFEFERSLQYLNGA
jgi:hypothetical protein